MKVLPDSSQIFSPPLKTEVRLRGLGTALPSLRLTQEESLRYILDNFGGGDGTKALYKRVLSHPSIKTRHFALAHPDEVLEKDRDKKNVRFEKWAVELSRRSLMRALNSAGLRPENVDFLVVATCTGYICPGLSAYVIEAANLRPDAAAADLVGMGCGAALPALRQAALFSAQNPGAVSAVICTEICSAAMYIGDAPDLVISNALFADGSAAALLSSHGNFDGNGSGPRFVGFYSHTVPAWRDSLRFKTQEGHLRNVLGKNVAAQAAEGMKILVDRIFHEERISAEDIDSWILHPGGEKILQALQARLSLTDEDLRISRNVLEDHGNMSSPTCLFVLEETLRTRRPLRGGRGLMASFGAGFSLHGALLEF